MARRGRRGKFLGISRKNIPYVVGAAAIGTLGLMWAASNLVKPGRHHGAIPFLPHLGGGGGHPMARHPMAHQAPAMAHLANVIPHSTHLPVGARVSGIGRGGGLYHWGAGRLGHKGGLGLAGGYYATT
jgi:hypothetical protein